MISKRKLKCMFTWFSLENIRNQISTHGMSFPSALSILVLDSYGREVVEYMNCWLSAANGKGIARWRWHLIFKWMPDINDIHVKSTPPTYTCCYVLVEGLMWIQNYELGFVPVLPHSYGNLLVRFRVLPVACGRKLFNNHQASVIAVWIMKINCSSAQSITMVVRRTICSWRAMHTGARREREEYSAVIPCEVWSTIKSTSDNGSVLTVNDGASIFNVLLKCKRSPVSLKLSVRGMHIIRWYILWSLLFVVTGCLRIAIKCNIWANYLISFVFSTYFLWMPELF